MRDRPLTGIRVLDLTNVLAGPYCSYQLALLGAEVIKVETPNTGDQTRQLAPTGANASASARHFWPERRQVRDRRPQNEQGKANPPSWSRTRTCSSRTSGPVLARLGFPSHLQQLNPRLVYCAISGFGQTGPMSQRPAYDQIIQGLSGMMSITGTPETAPLRVGFPVCDTIGGLAAAMAINAALVGRARTGRGHFIDVSMLEASLSAMGWVVSNYLIAGRLTQPMGDQNFTAAPSGTFQAADGPLNIAANRQEQYVTLCRILEREDLIDDERFRDREARKANREALNEELNAALRTRPAVEWEELLSAAGVPAARILTVDKALALEQLAERGFITELEMPGGLPRTLGVVGNGALFDGEPVAPMLLPPLLGDATLRSCRTQWMVRIRPP